MAVVCEEKVECGKLRASDRVGTAEEGRVVGKRELRSRLLTEPGLVLEWAEKIGGVAELVELECLE